MADRRLLSQAVVVALASLSVLGAASCHRREQKPVHVEALAIESAFLPKVTRPASKVAVSDQVLVVGDRTRSFLLVEPEGASAAPPRPLVLVFHGDGGTAKGFHAAFPFEASGATAYLAYPDGIDNTWDLETKTKNRDVAFIEALIDALAKRLPIDRTRVFLVGYSSGGFFSNVFACQRSKLVRAISSSAGGAPYLQAESWPNGFTRCPGQAPVAAMALHGEDDNGVTLDSGRFSASYWAYVDGCDEGSMETTGYSECQSYRGCPAGKNVVWCQIPGLGHWVWTRAAEASWTFFERVSEVSQAAPP
jgi:polyhydroxybutyrate depolymerase